MKRVVMCLVYSVLVIIISYLLYSYILPFIYPFLVALILSIILEPVVFFLSSKLDINRESCIILILTLITIILITLFYILLYNVFIESVRIITLLPTFIEKSIYYIDGYIKDSDISFFNKLDLNSIIDDRLNSVLSEALTVLNYVRTKALNIILSFPKIILFWVVVYVSTYFFLKERQKYTKLLVSQQNNLSDTVRSIKNKTIQSFGKIIKAQLIIIFFSVIITILGLRILNVKYAVTVGLVCGFLDILPFIGPSLLYIPWIIYLVINDQVINAIGLLIVFVLLIITRQLLQVKLFSRQFKIHPMLMIVSSYIGIKVFGPIGLILGPIISVFIKETIRYIPI